MFEHDQLIQQILESHFSVGSQIDTNWILYAYFVSKKYFGPNITKIVIDGGKYLQKIRKGGSNNFISNDSVLNYA